MLIEDVLQESSSNKNSPLSSLESESATSAKCLPSTSKEPSSLTSPSDSEDEDYKTESSNIFIERPYRIKRRYEDYLSEEDLIGTDLQAKK